MRKSKTARPTAAETFGKSFVDGLKKRAGRGPVALQSCPPRKKA